MSKRCLICEKELETDRIAVYDATVWTSVGNYGSRVYDPARQGLFLEGYICDRCLVVKTGLVEEVVTRTTHEEIERRPPKFGIST